MTENLTVDFVSSISEVSAEEWDALFPIPYPFIRHAFFDALERGGSIGALSGWVPRYGLVYQRTQLIAAIPWFLKSHSYGEYFFDWAFAEAYERYNLDYYPKLVCAIPFTPSSGARLGLAAGWKAEQVLPTIEKKLDELAIAYGVSNCQCLYLEDDLKGEFIQRGWWQRDDVQFQWLNHDYSSFDDFLAQLTSRKRKQIRKERHAVIAQGVEVRVLLGGELDRQFWLEFAQLYQLTYLKRSGHHGYLTPDSFMRLGEALADSIMVTAAFCEQKMVAAALYFYSDNTLYGRYWGCQQEFDFLHFETCYYAGIEFCIERGLSFFDAGAQGEHKLKRGFEPIVRHGVYRFTESPLTPAIEGFCTRERQMLAQYRAQAEQQLPFRKS
ncbi:GNAT family N-acetyltransferase [Aliidiomarina minuta]|uniref:GNAT family N-acetyltransferase n=1 Tax=Aliidiomarina minuta TaxID=880057 RepID=A0A432W488_9GAMM|nr:GNAT family N-acetyltransferase [Aliidiomarina minuta]RUO24079.1 GNAT family N-acetyltransferase [Aliidiomarina minuta]